jgi:hypothetical protein
MILNAVKIQFRPDNPRTLTIINCLITKYYSVVKTTFLMFYNEVKAFN